MRNDENVVPLFVDKIFSKDFRQDFNHGLCGFARIIWLTCKFLCLTFFSRKDTKNNSLREHRSVASYIRLKASFQQLSNLHPYCLHQLFLVTQRAKAHLRCYAKGLAQRLWASCAPVGAQSQSGACSGKPTSWSDEVMRS